MTTYGRPRRLAGRLRSGGLGFGGRLLYPILAVTGVVLVVAAVVLTAMAIRPKAVDGAGWMPANVPASATGVTASPPGPKPTRLRIKAIGVDSTLEDLRVDGNGVLQAPKDFGRAGWYVQGSRPGDVGPAIIAGHVDSYQGPAVFFRLHELEQGATIEVERGKGTWVSFKVLAVRRYPKADFPTDEVYAPTPNAQLRLITCGGAFDNTRRSYLDNVVVYAAAT